MEIWAPVFMAKVMKNLPSMAIIVDVTSSSGKMRTNFNISLEFKVYRSWVIYQGRTSTAPWRRQTRTWIKRPTTASRGCRGPRSSPDPPAVRSWRRRWTWRKWRSGGSWCCARGHRTCPKSGTFTKNSSKMKNLKIFFVYLTKLWPWGWCSASASTRWTSDAISGGLPDFSPSARILWIPGRLFPRRPFPKWPDFVQNLLDQLILFGIICIKTLGHSDLPVRFGDFPQDHFTLFDSAFGGQPSYWFMDEATRWEISMNYGPNGC